MPNAKLIISYFISLALILAVFLFIDPFPVLARLASFGLPEAAAGMTLVFATYVLRAVKWQALLKPFANVSTSEAYNVTLTGFFINNFLPLRAGEIGRAFILNKRHPIGKLKIFSTIIVERIVEGVTITAIFAFAIFFTPAFPKELLNFMVFFLLMFAVLLLAFIFSGFTKKFLKKMFGFSDFFRKKIVFLFEEIFIGEAALKTGIKPNIIVWGSAFLLWGVNFALYLLVANAMMIKIGFFELAIVLSVTTLSTVIPSAPAYIGTFEAAFVVTFAAFGLDAESATSMALMTHLLLFAGTTIFGLISLNSLKLSFFDLLKLGKEKKVGFNEK